MPQPIVQTPDVDPATWTPIYPPSPRALLSACLVSNQDATSGLKLRTDQADADTEVTILAGASLSITRSDPNIIDTHAAVFYLQTVAGIGPVKVIWA